MKRESGILHHFSFGERFDEAVMNTYCNSNKYIAYTCHQFIGFSSLNKSVGKDMWKLYNTHNSICPSCATRFRELRISARRVEQLSELSRATQNFELGDLAIRVAGLVFYTRLRHRLLRNRKAIAY